MLNKIEYLIPIAFEAISEQFQDDLAENGIKKGYQGAVSGFGATLLQMGLLPTLAVYSDQSDSADINRKKLLKALLYIVCHGESKLSDEDKELLRPFLGQNDLTGLLFVVANEVEQPALQKNLMDAALALKLVIRTYQLV